MLTLRGWEDSRGVNTEIEFARQRGMPVSLINLLGRRSRTMSELHIEQWPVERLRPYKRNPRKNDHVVSRMVDACVSSDSVFHCWPEATAN